MWNVEAQWRLELAGLSIRWKETPVKLLSFHKYL